MMEKLTEKKLIKLIEEILEDTKKESSIIFYNWCETKGIVTRSNLDLNLCNNPNCKSCRELSKAIKETVEERFNKT